MRLSQPSLPVTGELFTVSSVSTLRSEPGALARCLLPEASPCESRACVRASRGAGGAFRRSDEKPVSGARRACSRASFADQSSWREELFFKTFPHVDQTVPGDDGLKTFGVQRAGFNELEKPGFVFRAAGLERDRGQMFGGEDLRGRAGDVNRYSIAQCFFEQRASRRKKLHWPVSNDDELALHSATAGCEVI